MTAALILAGGAGALRQTGAVTAAQRMVLTFRQAGVERIVVVGGATHGQLQKSLAHMGVICLPGGPHISSRPLAGLKQGLACFGPHYSHVLVATEEAPLFTADTVRLLLAHGASAPCVPLFEERAGGPLLLDEASRQKLVDGPDDGSLAAALQACGTPATGVPVQDAGVLPPGVGRPLEELLRRHSLKKLHPALKVYLAAEKPFYGPGPHQLLRLIEETKAMRTACQLMGISYSKGWKMVAEMERQSGQKLLQRQRGGTEKGRSELTEKGRELLEKYSLLQSRCTDAMYALYEEIFPEGF